MRLDAFDQPQPHQQKFVGDFTGLQFLVDRQTDALRFDALEPPFRLLVGFGGVAPSVDIQAAVRARTGL